MLTLLTRRWRIVLFNGACAIVLASLVFSWRSIAPASLAVCFGMYCLINGAVAIAAARGAKRRANKLRREFLTIGFLSLCAGSVALLWADVSMQWLAMVVAAWAMSVGIVEVWTALRIREFLPAERLFLLIGLSSIFLDLVLAVLVFSAVSAIPLALAAMMAIRGGLFIALACKQLGYRVMSRSEAARDHHSVGLAGLGRPSRPAATLRRLARI